MDLRQVMEIIKQNRIEFIRFESPDVNGISRGKLVALANFERVVEKGLAMVSDLLTWDPQADVAWLGTGYAEDITFSDLLFFPDLSTFKVVPWADHTARVFGDLHFYDGRPAMGSSRHVFRHVLDLAKEMNYLCRSGHEYEFYILDSETEQPIFGGHQIMTTLKHEAHPILRDIQRHMTRLGIEITTCNTEWGPAQYEINFNAADGMAGADQAFTWKNGLKEIAEQHGLLITLMTKPWIDKSANGSHVHISLLDADTGQNVFVDPSSADGLSDTCRWFIGGQLAHARALAALMAPTINCYKRYQPNSYAPNSISWGHENRSVGVRIKAWRGKGTHIENRMACGSSNPYLVGAACLAAGLDGIRRKIEPPEPISTNAYNLEHLDRIPGSLEEALDALQDDEPLLELLTREGMQTFIVDKQYEIAKAKAAIPDYGSPEFQARVDPWERDEFMELI
jgi:glutamine synthetase